MALVSLDRFSMAERRVAEWLLAIRLLGCIMLVLAATFPIGAAEQGQANSAKPSRVADSLQVFYDFHSSGDGRVADRAESGEPLDLRISDSSMVLQREDGLQIVGTSILHTDQPPRRLIAALEASREVTIEAWIRPAKLNQGGPARIVTLSRDTNQRNFTLGQDGDAIEVRLRTDKTNLNGLPGLRSKTKSLAARVTHLVYTLRRDGQSRLYVDGLVNSETKSPGTLAKWDGQCQLALANELSGDRPWLGTLHLVAIYSRALTASEVERNFQAGPHGFSPASALADAGARLFETGIAPLFATHCLECHDAATKQGGLNLARKTASFAGGESGPAIVPGQSAASLLWQKIEADDMPHDRPSLTSREKRLVREWIDQGAPWTLEAIDPAVYVHGAGAQQVFVQRLTVPEYIETVRFTTGVDIAKEARELLPRDQRADGFSNTAYNLNVDLGHVEAYARLAGIIASRMDVKALARKRTKSRELTDENITKVITPLGRQLLRGPISKEEIDRYCGISTSVAAAGGDFEEAISYIVQAMLQSPRFLYRIERQRGVGFSAPVDPFELTSRVSYILWGGPPDDALLAAAEKGNLAGDALESQVRRMLDDRRAVEQSRRFIAEWLNLSRLDGLRPNADRFADWDRQLSVEMREETLAFFEEVAWKQNRPLSDLLNARLTFLTPRLARHYGLPLAVKPGDNKLIRYDLSNTPGRGGLLTHASVLSAGGDEASTVARGLFLMHELLRGVVRDPPPCVDTTPVPTKPGLSKRAVAELRLANQSCAGCHVKFEPLAFGLEKFDGRGRYLETDEHGNRLRDDGEILAPGEEKPVAFRSSEELMDLLASSDRVRQTLTWKIAQFALGRPLGASDAPHVAEIHRQAQAHGGTYRSVIAAIILSDLVQKARTEHGAVSDPKPSRP